MYSVITLVIVIIVGDVVHCSLDISATPRTQDNFDINKYLGTWYDQGKVAPCGWSGSNEFTDWKLDFMYEGSTLYLVQNWRSGSQCVNVKSMMMEQSPGCYIVKDPLGDLFTGEDKIVATDYKRFSITWGCTKRSVDGVKCSSPWLSVETRKAHPDRYTIAVIDKVLRKLFGFGFDQTDKVIHEKAC